MNNSCHQTLPKQFPSLLKFGKGERILTQDDLFGGYFLIKSGLVKTVRNQKKGTSRLLSIKNQGEFLGEFYEEEGCQKSSYSAYALEDNTWIEMISWEEDPSHKLNRILRTLQEEIFSARMRLERMLYIGAEERIIQVIKDLGYRLGKKFGDETLLKLPLTHEEIAMLTDTSRQTVTMVLSSLKSQNKINYSRGRILFRNLDSL